MQLLHSNKAIVFIVGPDPEPDDARTIFDSQGAVVQPNPRRPETANLF
jgi:hypothetical protein